MARRIVDIALGRPAASPHPFAACSRLSAAAGLYHDAASDDVFAIVVEGDVPLLRTNSSTHKIEEIGSNLFAPEFGVLPLRSDAIIINTQWTRYLRLRRIAGPI